MKNPIETAADSFLAAYHLEAANNRLRKDLQSNRFDRRPSVVVFIDIEALYLAAIELRGLTGGPVASCPILEIRDHVGKLLEHMIFENICDLPFYRGERTQFDQVLIQIRQSFIQKINDYLYNCKYISYIYPISAIDIQNTLTFRNFTLHTPHSFEALVLERTGNTPSNDFSKIIAATSSWLEIKSPNKFHADSLKRVVLGSLALASLDRYRYQVTIAAPAKNHFTLDRVLYFNSSADHTPALGTKVEIQSNDFVWLSQIDALLENHASNFSARSLKYFYRSWFETDHDRMATLFSCIDVFSNKISVPSVNQSYCETNKIAAKKPFVEAISADANLNEVRLGLLYAIRSDISHGRSPNIYESKNYLKYVKKYKFEPLADLEAIADLMLRKRAFENKIPTRSDPYAALISAAQQQGILPREQINRSILFDPSE